jgi:flagellar biosynthesis/type III secretory pathway protein FliH
MAPGNSQSHRGSKPKRKATTTSDAGRVPTKNTPPEPFPTEDSQGHCNFEPISSFDAAVERFADSNNPGVTFRQIWDSAIEIGRRNSSNEVGVEESAEARDQGFKEGRLLGTREGLEEGKALGK